MALLRMSLRTKALAPIRKKEENSRGSKETSMKTRDTPAADVSLLLGRRIWRGYLTRRGAFKDAPACTSFLHRNFSFTSLRCRLLLFLPFRGRTRLLEKLFRTLEFIYKGIGVFIFLSFFFFSVRQTPDSKRFRIDRALSWSKVGIYASRIIFLCGSVNLYP